MKGIAIGCSLRRDGQII